MDRVGFQIQFRKTTKSQILTTMTDCFPFEKSLRALLIQYVLVHKNQEFECILTICHTV